MMGDIRIRGEQLYGLMYFIKLRKHKSSFIDGEYETTWHQSRNPTKLLWEAMAGEAIKRNQLE